MKLIKGNELDQTQRRQVLSAFVYRWTVENPFRTQVYKCSLCDILTPYENKESANGHTHPTIPLMTDQEFLNTHAFWFTNNNYLSNKKKHAEIL